MRAELYRYTKASSKEEGNPCFHTPRGRPAVARSAKAKRVVGAPTPTGWWELCTYHRAPSVSRRMRLAVGGFCQNRNRFSPVSASKRRSTVPSIRCSTISQVALTTARFRCPPKTSPFSLPALM